MTTDDRLSEEDIDWLKSYRAQVVEIFCARFDDAGDRFQEGKRLINRFISATDTVLEHGRGHFRAVDETHNELCIAHALLLNSNPRFDRLEYEPPLSGTDKSIDFRAVCEEMTAFIDVKTIKPASHDRWDQYQRALEEGWFPENVSVMLSGAWLGGELWHNMFAARSRMLEHAVELERKISEASLADSGKLFVLAFCGEGFHWHQDELEDFVSFYQTGQYRADDPFSVAESKYMDEQGISLNRTISRFACMRRDQGEMDFKRLNWNVLPPNFPPFSA